MDFNKIVTQAKAALEAYGMNPDAVPLVVEGKTPTGKGALELIILEIARAVVAEIQTNAVVTTTLDQGLNGVFNAGVPVATDGGAALQTAWKAQTTGGAKDDATGGIA